VRKIKIGGSSITIELYNEDANGMPVVIAPGYMTDGDKSWGENLSKIIHSPIIFVQWRSSSFSELLWGLGITTVAGVFLPFRAATLPASLAKKVRDSWSRISELANDAGNCLARFLNDVWDGDEKALFIGHSLGVRVITEAMKQLNNANVLSSVSIAGAILQPLYDENISKANHVHSPMHVNIHSGSDLVLNYLYRIFEVSLEKPLGINESKLGNVENINLDIGHTSYLSNKKFMRYIALHYKQARAMYYARGYGEY
jgi:predicted alpha/beta hydrolase family esterase